jgi:hypothetical protein
VTCLPKLLTTSVVIAASLLGGCSDNFMTAVSPARSQSDATVLAAVKPQPALARALAAAAPRSSRAAADDPAPPRSAAMPSPPPPLAQPTLQTAVALGAAPRTAGSAPADRKLRRRLAAVALGDQDLSQIRGGFEASSGVVLNFAFQQATYIDHNLAQTVVVPTLTIAPSAGGASVAGASPMTGAAPNVNVGSLTGLGVSAQTQSAVGAAKLLANGTVQAQVSAASPLIQAMVNSGMTSVVSSLGNGGLTSILSNTANNRLVQQTTTIDVGVSGLSGLMQQSIPTSVLNRISGPNLFR